MSTKDEEVRIKTRWRSTVGEPSSTVKQLWSKLLRKEKPASTCQDIDTRRETADDGEMNNGNERNLPDI